MRYLLAIPAVSGMVVSALALREHYRTDTSPAASMSAGIAASSITVPTLRSVEFRLLSSASPDTFSSVCSPCAAHTARLWPPPSQGLPFHFTSLTSRRTFWGSGAFTASPHSE